MKAKIMHGFMVVVLLFMQLMNLGGYSNRRGDDAGSD